MVFETRRLQTKKGQVDFSDKPSFEEQGRDENRARNQFPKYQNCLFVEELSGKKKVNRFKPYLSPY